MDNTFDCGKPETIESFAKKACIQITIESFVVSRVNEREL